MTDTVESLILEHLDVPRHEVKVQGTKLDEQFESVRLRLSSIDSRMAGIHGDIAIIHGCIDNFESRLDRIEQRLELGKASDHTDAFLNMGFV